MADAMREFAEKFDGRGGDAPKAVSRILSSSEGWAGLPMARAEVLKDEARMTPEQGPKCKLSSGRWYSAYDDQYIDGPSGLDVDQRVPLAKAWDSGASAWSVAERQAYANDLGDERSLIAVSAKSDRSKADQDTCATVR